MNGDKCGKWLYIEWRHKYTIFASGEQDWFSFSNIRTISSWLNCVCVCVCVCTVYDKNRKLIAKARREKYDVKDTGWKIASTSTDVGRKKRCRKKTMDPIKQISIKKIRLIVEGTRPYLSAKNFSLSSHSITLRLLALLFLFFYSFLYTHLK